MYALTAEVHAQSLLCSMKLRSRAATHCSAQRRHCLLLFVAPLMSGTKRWYGSCADGKKEIITASLDKTMALWRLEVRHSMPVWPSGPVCQVSAPAGALVCAYLQGARSPARPCGTSCCPGFCRPFSPYLVQGP